MKIGDVLIPGFAALAPMAGVTDMAFRQICREFGAGYTVGEMVSAKGLIYNDRKTKALLAITPDEHPSAVQIFGSDSDIFPEAARMAMEISGADILDINMGCPTGKIVSNGDGCALMRDVPRAERIIKNTVAAVNVPVTVKFRLGWDEDSISCVEFAKMAEAAGASAVCLHARTRAQQYSGRADWSYIARVREAVSIPLIANGDVFSPDDAVRLYESTGADYIMAGRGALGNPWIFRDINARLRGESSPPAPSLRERLEVAARQIESAAQYKGEHIACLEARKHLAWYLKGQRGMAAYRARFAKIANLREMHEIVAEVLNN